MLNRRIFIAASAATLLPNPLAAEQTLLDAVILTGVDNSNSLYRNKRISGVISSLEETLADREVQNILTSGRTGTILFGIYLWGTSTRWLAPPELVSRSNPGFGLQPALNALKKHHTDITGRPAAPGVYIKEVGDPGTNVIQALAFGIRNLKKCPPGKRILNIVTDDDTSRTDEKETLLALRHDAEAANITGNGLIIGQTDIMDHYFEKYLMFGEGAFVLNAEKFENMRAAWRAKFLADVAAFCPAAATRPA